MGILLTLVVLPSYAFTYTTTITDKDRYNSSGDRLTSVRAILRQDRANLYRFNRSDVGDEGDPAFGRFRNRGMFDAAPVSVSPGLARKIIYGGPVEITVDVSRDGIDVYRN